MVRSSCKNERSFDHNPHEQPVDHSFLPFHSSNVARKVLFCYDGARYLTKGLLWATQIYPVP